MSAQLDTSADPQHFLECVRGLISDLEARIAMHREELANISPDTIRACFLEGEIADREVQVSDLRVTYFPGEDQS